jgi:pSer/pThr/pTyr-binding forkhead associated (FHA) protein
MDSQHQENQGIPILSLAQVSRALTPQVFAKTFADTFLVGLPAQDDDDGEDWAYQTTYIRSVPGSDGRMAFVDVKSTRVFPLRKARKGAFADTILVGRAASNDVCIDHSSVSKLHARIRRLPEGGLRLSDASSLNGTKLNDRPIGGDVPLRDTDRVVFGSIAVEVYDAWRLHQLLMRLR